MNLGVLQTRFPRLAERVLSSGFHEQVCSFSAQDGAPAYGLRKDGRIQPVTNPVNPLANINQQLNEWADKLQDFTRPIFVLGVHPGLEVLHLFNLREQAVGHPCEQPLWICMDSMPAFCGFLQTYDAQDLLRSSRVELFVKEELPARVEWLRANPQFPYLFSMISMSPPPVQQAVLAPLIELIQERSQQIKTYQAADEAYYAAISDAQLAETLAGKAGRKPRVMVPTCPWSTVIQYSIRDTVAAFEQAGWETLVLDSPAMLTPHYAMESIHRFQPDLFLYINHLRQEVLGVIPDDLLMVSWIQDPLPHVNNVAAAKKWNEWVAPRKRDLIVGYTGQLKPYGYLEDRLAPLSMIVDTQLFKPRELTPAQIEKYGCDVCFASNAGMPTDRRVQNLLVPLFEKFGLDEAALMDYHDRLWAYYRAEKTITSYSRLIDFLGLEAQPTDEVVQLLFWRLNDVIYRHVVIEWLDDYAQRHPGFKLHLYGEGWDSHPRFARYAQGPVAHGQDLSIAYQAAKRCLHLNSYESGHQRVFEVLASGAKVLSRSSCRHSHDRIRSQAIAKVVMKQLTPGVDFAPFCAEEVVCLNDHFFSLAQKCLQSSMTVSQLEACVCSRCMTWLNQEGRCILNICEEAFGSKSDMKQVLSIDCFTSAMSSAHMVSILNAQHRIQYIQQHIGVVLGKSEWNPFQNGTIYSDFNALLNYAHLIYKKGALRTVCRAYDAIEFPGFSVTNSYACYLLDNRQTEMAQRVVSGVNIAGISSEQTIHYALLLVRLDQFERAVEVVERVYRIDRDVRDGYARIAWQKYWKQRSYPELITWFDKDDSLGRLSPNWKLNWALAVEGEGRGQAAVHIVESVYAESADARNGYAKLASSCLARWDYQKFLHLLGMDRDLGRLSLKSLNRLPLALALNGAYEEAEHVVTDLYEENLSLRDCHATVGWRLFYAEHHLAKALVWFKKDHELGRLSASMCARFITVLASSGESKAARAEADRLKGVADREDGAQFLAVGDWNRGALDSAWQNFHQQDRAGFLHPKFSSRYGAIALLRGRLDEAEDIAARYQVSVPLQLHSIFTLCHSSGFDLNINHSFLCDVAETQVSACPDSKDAVYAKMNMGFLTGQLDIDPDLFCSLKSTESTHFLIALAFRLLLCGNGSAAERVLSRLTPESIGSAQRLFEAAVCFTLIGMTSRGQGCIDRLHSISPYYFMRRDMSGQRDILWALSVMATDSQWYGHCLTFVRRLPHIWHFWGKYFEWLKLRYPCDSLDFSAFNFRFNAP